MTSLDGFTIEVQTIPHNADDADQCSCKDAPWPGQPYVSIPDTAENRLLAHQSALNVWNALNEEPARDVS